MDLFGQFSSVWFVDFEFLAGEGGRPKPLCMVAVEVRSGQRIVLWAEELSAHSRAPFDVGPDSLIVAFYASAEIGCFLALGWELPRHLLDLYAEFRRLTNGLPLPSGRGLLGALTWFGLGAMTHAEKGSNRELVLRGGPYSAEERDRILRYCAADVEACLALAAKMAAQLPPQALLRGRYMAAVARMEWTGVPVDVATLERLKAEWDRIPAELIQRVDASYGVYRDGSFSQQQFAAWLHSQGIRWPVLDSGRLALDDDTFKDMAKRHPQLSLLRELRTTLSQLRLNQLAVGPDGRNRTLLSPFSSRSSRNQPSNAKFIFGPATWLRSLIQPAPGMALAYVDYSQQEFGIAAALSGDEVMRGAYLSGDPYLGLAKAAGAVPADATKKSHPRERELFKVTTLGVQYGMSDIGLANQLGVSPIEARDLLALHRRTFGQYWRWNDAAADYAMLRGEIHTTFGWTLHVTTDTKPRSVRNFPMQANGAEILRMACCLATERGIPICAPVHDALLVEGPADQINEVVRETQACMREAGEIVLGGFPLASDVKIIRAPDRYTDPRGEKMWQTVMEIIDTSGNLNPSQPCGDTPRMAATPA